MRILYVAPRFPYPLSDGDRARAYNLLKYLNRRHEVTLITPVWDAGIEHPEKISECYAKIITVPVSKKERIFRLLLGIFTKKSFRTSYYYSPKIRKAVFSELAAMNYDRVQAQLLMMEPAVRGAHVPTIIDLCDSVGLVLDRWLQREESFLKKIVLNIEKKRCDAEEARIVRQYKHVLIGSEIDKEYMGNTKSLELLPNGVDIEVFRLASYKRQANTIVFVGNLAYPPNADAVAYFIKDIFPLVRSKIPQVRLTVVGVGVTPKLSVLARPGMIEFTGKVPDVREYLWKSAVAIAPMRSGTGVQLKVLEAMATGTPIVVTPYSIGKLSIQTEMHLLVAKDAAEFARDVVRLLTNSVLSEKIVHNARTLVENQYSWEAIVTRLESVYVKSISN